MFSYLHTMRLSRHLLPFILPSPRTNCRRRSKPPSCFPPNALRGPVSFAVDTPSIVVLAPREPVCVCVCVCVCARDILHSHVCLSGRYIGAYPHANTHTHIHTHTHHHRPRTCCTHRVLRVKLSRRHASCGSVRVAVLSTRLTSVRRCRTTIGRHGNGVSIYCA